MYLLFRRFGTILSVHTMVNKSTGLSKGFGFVSYSAHQEAHAAISEMDGFRLGKKRLKVQLKRSQDDNPDLLGDEDEEDDGSEAPFYPSSQYDGQSAHQDQLLQQQRQHLEHGQPRCASFASNFSSSGYETSGHTTRASTPPMAPLAVRGSCTDSIEGYFDGVNSSTGHSPVDELEQQEQQQMEDMFGQMRAKGGTEESEQLSAAVASRDGDDSKVLVVGVPTSHQSRPTTDSKKTSAEKNRGAK